MSQFVDHRTVCVKLSDIPRRGARRLVAPGGTVAVFRTAGDQVFALQDQCPHKQGPLSEGIVHDACVTCPLHNWVISLETGQATGADKGSVPAYPARVEGEHVLITLEPLR